MKVPKVRTGSGSQPGRTAATCRVAPMSTAAAWGWTGAMSRAGRECFRRVMAGTSSGPGWRGGAARKNQFPNRDRLGVTTLKSAAARGPSFVSGSGPPKTGRPLPSAADHSAGCFSRHRRNEFRDRFVAHQMSASNAGAGLWAGWASGARPRRPEVLPRSGVTRRFGPGGPDRSGFRPGDSRRGTAGRGRARGGHPDSRERARSP